MWYTPADQSARQDDRVGAWLPMEPDEVEPDVLVPASDVVEPITGAIVVVDADPLETVPVELDAGEFEAPAADVLPDPEEILDPELDEDPPLRVWPEGVGWVVALGGAVTTNITKQKTAATP